jgi:hypothetical protein
MMIWLISIVENVIFHVNFVGVPQNKTVKHANLIERDIQPIFIWK